MIDDLFALDRTLFYAINHGWSNPVFDAVMPVVTDTALWRPIYAVGLLALAIWGGRRGRWCAALLVLGVAIADPLSSALLKESIGRLRPFDVLPDVIKLRHAAGGSFPSNHALNNTMAATTLWHFYPRLRWLWVSIAVLVALSRPYVGVHWPSDIVGGAILGFAGSLLLLSIARRVAPHLPPLWRLP